MTVDIENKEWPEDGKLPELVGKANPFAVPEGYFDGLDERIMAAVTMAEIKNTVTDAGFITPEGYFENLAETINASITIEELADKQQESYAVPAGYFDELSSNIISRVAIEEAMQAGEGFELPAAYFENLSSQIQSRVFVEDALATEEAFIVPDRYFDKLNAKILNQTVTQETVKRKGGIVKLMRSTAFKYATAACFVLVAGVGYLFAPSASTVEQHDASYLHKELSNVPMDELRGYIQLSMDGTDIQHTVAVEDLPVKEAAFNAELQDYVDEL